MKYLTLVLCAVVGSLPAIAQENTPEQEMRAAEAAAMSALDEFLAEAMAKRNTPEQQLLMAERAPYTSNYDGRQDPSSVPDFVVWGGFFMDYHGLYYADVEHWLTREDATALRNGATQWGTINDHHNMEAVNDLADIVGVDVDNIDPVAVAEEFDRRHEARRARLMAVANTTLASLSGPGRWTVEQYVDTNIRSRGGGSSFDDVGYARAYPERYRESLRFKLLPAEEQKRLFFDANPELDPANREDRSQGDGFTLGGSGPDGRIGN